MSDAAGELTPRERHVSCLRCEHPVLASQVQTVVLSDSLTIDPLCSGCHDKIQGTLQ